MPFISYAQNFEDVTLWRALKEVTDGFFIDIGAWDADLHSVTRAFSERGWRGINVEPVPALCERIGHRRPRDVTLCVAIGVACGEGAFYNVAESGLSTANAAAAAAYEAQGWSVEQLVSQVRTLAQLCREHAPGIIHFLKVDCEGGERDVLLGADFKAFRPWIVLVEATEPLTQTPSFDNWEPILFDAGYHFAWFDGLNRFYVADEKCVELLHRVAVPPNCFDDFVLARNTQPWPPVSRAPVPALVPGLPASRPAVLSGDDRVDLARRCRDCDDLPKVSDAGLIQHENDGTAVQIMHNGLKIPCIVAGSWMQRLITRCNGHYEPQAERLFHEVVRLLPPNATMLEVGGKWAYYSAWFIQGAPQRRAVVLQPDERDLGVGQRTMMLNGLHATFVHGFADTFSVSLAPFQAARSGSLLLPSYSVPHLMGEHRMAYLDLMRCDVQGAELAVLQGCVESFNARRIGLVFLSTHPPAFSGDPITHDRCLDLLRSCGAVIEAEYDAYESFSGEGLIVARFAPALEGWRPMPASRAPRNQAVFRHPSFDLAEAWTQASAQVGQPGKALDEMPSTPDLIRPLHQHGVVFPTNFSQAGLAVTIGNCPIFEADGTPDIFVVYGPYCSRPAGDYECMFLVRVDRADLAADAPTILFDVAAHEPENSGYAQACLYGDLLPGEFVPVRFVFTLKTPASQLETRLRVAGPAAIAVVAAVALRQSR